MIVPVPDIGPGISRFGNLPVDSIFGNSIWIITVFCCGIEKFTNYMLQIKRVGIAQSFPVLKNISPVPLIIEFSCSVTLFSFNGKEIPGSAGITMASAESQREIFVPDSLQICIILTENKSQNFIIIYIFSLNFAPVALLTLLIKSDRSEMDMLYEL